MKFSENYSMRTINAKVAQMLRNEAHLFPDEDRLGEADKLYPISGELRQFYVDRVRASHIRRDNSWARLYRNEGKENS